MREESNCIHGVSVQLIRGKEKLDSIDKYGGEHSINQKEILASFKRDI
jgi:hypothetical protein